MKLGLSSSFISIMLSTASSIEGSLIGPKLVAFIIFWVESFKSLGLLSLPYNVLTSPDISLTDPTPPASTSRLLSAIFLNFS